MTYGNVLEAVLVAVLAFAVLFALDGWVAPPGFRTNRQSIKATKLPFKFSLRTLLIVTTLVAVGLGLIVWATNSVELHTLGGPSRIVNDHGRLIEK